jgi:hypothetical protein
MLRPLVNVSRADGAMTRQCAGTSGANCTDRLRLVVLSWQGGRSENSGLTLGAA